MKYHFWIRLFIFLLFACSAHATVIEHIGSYGGWGSVSWTAISGLNDPTNGVAEELDFVGDANDHAGYWGRDNDYLFFRMRLDADTTGASVFSGAHLVLIDAIGYSTDNGDPDYAFAWDSKSVDPTKHGLEMMIPDELNDTWDTTRMDDIDVSNGQKLANDINGLGRTTDGYVRSSDGHTTTEFGDTTFLDFAVSLSYLSNHVPTLVQNSSWRIQFASIANATDHNPLTEDIAGNANPSDIISIDAWSDSTAIPEPLVSSFICIFAGGFMVVRRLFRN